VIFYNVERMVEVPRGIDQNSQQEKELPMKNIIFATIALLSPTLCWGALVNGIVGRVTQLWTYTDFNGDVVINVQTPVTQCQDGFWLRMTDTGAKQVYAAVLAAFHAQTPLSVYAYDDQLWTGTTGHVCRVYVIANAPGS